MSISHFLYGPSTKLKLLKKIFWKVTQWHHHLIISSFEYNTSLAINMWKFNLIGWVSFRYWPVKNAPSMSCHVKNDIITLPYFYLKHIPAYMHSNFQSNCTCWSFIWNSNWFYLACQKMHLTLKIFKNELQNKWRNHHDVTTSPDLNWILRV